MLNQVILMGRLVADPELRRTASGTEVCSVAIACERDNKNDDGSRTADFFDVVAWRQTAKYLCDWHHKGDLIAVHGRLQARKWKDKDGNNRLNFEILAINIYACGKREKPAEMDEIDEPDDGTLPF